MIDSRCSSPLPSAGHHHFAGWEHCALQDLILHLTNATSSSSPNFWRRNDTDAEDQEDFLEQEIESNEINWRDMACDFLLENLRHANTGSICRITPKLSTAVLQDNLFPWMELEEHQEMQKKLLLRQMMTSVIRNMKARLGGSRDYWLAFGSRYADR